MDLKDLYIFFVCRAKQIPISLSCYLLPLHQLNPSQVGSGPLSLNKSSHMPWMQHDSLWLLYDRGQTRRQLLAFSTLCAHFLPRLDDDVNGPLSTSSWLLPLILTHLLLRWGPYGPQTLGGGHLCGRRCAVSLQLVSGAAFWAVLLRCATETKDIKCQLDVNTQHFCRCVRCYGNS